MKRLKIAYVTTYNALDVNNWSGLGYFIAKTLEKHLGNVEFIGNLKIRKYLLNYLKKAYCKLIEHKYFHEERTKKVGQYYAFQVENLLKGKNYDLIFSPGTIPIAYLDTKIPKIFWADANWHSMLDYYFQNVSKLSIKDGDRMEQLALSTSLLAIYSSNWAANTALKFYNVSEEKVKVIPFGANITEVPILEDIKHKLNIPIKLLFVGRDWERKGGEIAYNTMVELNNMGIKCTLTVVGCTPPELFTKNKNLIVIPFIDKNNPSERKILNNLYADSNFFILPSRKEAYGVVFCEACAFGLPILSSITGGIPTIVKDGVNGYLLPLEANGIDYAKKINDIIDSGEYENLCKSTRQRYEEELNWDVSGQKLAKILSEYF